MKTPGLVVPLTAGSGDLVGFALFQLTSERQRFLEFTIGTKLNAIQIVNFEPDAFIESVGREPDLALVEDCEVIEVADNGDTDYVPGLTDLGRVRAIRLNVTASGDMWWTGIASRGHSDEDTPVRTATFNLPQVLSALR